MIAIGVCAAVCLALTIFAMQTKWDFTLCGGILFVSVIVLLMFGIVAICIPSKVVDIVYASLGALVFSIYLVIDTQLMLGGKHNVIEISCWNIVLHCHYKFNSYLLSTRFHPKSTSLPLSISTWILSTFSFSFCPSLVDQDSLNRLLNCYAILWFKMVNLSTHRWRKILLHLLQNQVKLIVENYRFNSN